MITHDIIKGIPLERLAEICEAERGGRCVVLPCKVGERVYFSDYLNDYIFAKEYRFVGDTSNEIQARFDVHGKGQCTRFISEFSKTVFLTRAEAEKALEVQNER